MNNMNMNPDRFNSHTQAKAKSSKGSSLLLAAAAAGAYMYFKKPENREKLRVAVNNVKTQVNNYLDGKTSKPNTQMTKTGFSDPYDPDDNRMVEEGAMTSVQYYNESYQDNKSKINKKAAYPKSQRQKMPETKELKPDHANESPAKQENTVRYADNPNNPIN